MHSSVKYIFNKYTLYIKTICTLAVAHKRSSFPNMARKSNFISFILIPWCQNNKSISIFFCVFTSLNVSISTFQCNDLKVAPSWYGIVTSRRWCRTMGCSLSQLATSTTALTLLTTWLDCGKRMIRKISNAGLWASYRPYHGLELPSHEIKCGM